jgi:signal transduction histidine kinase
VQAAGLILRCAADGAIVETVRNELGISATRLDRGRPFALTVDRASLSTALDLVVHLRAHGVAFGWLLHVSPADREVADGSRDPLWFAGLASGSELWIAAAATGGELARLFQDLMRLGAADPEVFWYALEDCAGRLDASRRSRPAPDPPGLAEVFEDLSRLTADLVRLQRQVAKQNAKLRSLGGLKDRFLGMAAHDLRTPLSVIRGHSALLQRDLGDVLQERHLHQLSVITSSSDFMLRLVNSLLDVATIASGKLRLERQPASLAAIVRRSVTANTALAQAKDVRLELHCGSPLPELRLDEPRIEQVLNNLLSNAIKFSYPGGIIRIELTARDRQAVLTVGDDGPGIPPERLGDLFEWFSTGRTRGTAGEPGTGLGLAISRGIVDGHGGTITVESTPGQGATFRVTLPLPAQRRTR